MAPSGPGYDHQAVNLRVSLIRSEVMCQNKFSHQWVENYARLPSVLPAGIRLDLTMVVKQGTPLLSALGPQQTCYSRVLILGLFALHCMQLWATLPKKTE